MSNSRTTLTADRQALIRPLLQPDVALAVTDPQGRLAVPFATELACLSANAVAKRQREFAAGRAAAHAAMADLGHRPQAIVIGKNRAPLWPEGLTGSITHSRSCAIAIVARNRDVLALGIDVEEDRPLADKLLPAICSDAEQEWLMAQANPGQLAKLIFSAKEAAYKCQYSVSQRYFGFDGLELALDLAQGGFQARFTADQLPFVRGDVIDGRFAIGAGVIVTLAELRP
ncbi:4'-phosphopantetheinyl transferase family protein [Parasedimentitalea psychrophila]|uniref:Enterobactin synthase component D n=1 Tax=Parasedimentitalea psychrophila TaxID=2997337 RepID=A0A9Y2KVI0_9RHOB|nr:4'-phosphopantetheinyl transferase superfamily protein [Parasedimentitalea psychrophila]WIY23443.1 4'-phosphopantetheinyl transferase superfamily protein [Parasedimentitalea psychrophila]